MSLIIRKSDLTFPFSLVAFPSVNVQPAFVWCISSLGCCNKLKTGQVKTTEIYSLSSGGQKPRMKVLARAMLTLMVLEKICSLLLLSSSGSRCVLVYGHLNSISASVATLPPPLLYQHYLCLFLMMIHVVALRPI